MSTPMKNKLLTTREVAERCCVTARTVARWIREGELKAVKLSGKTWRVREADLDDFIEGQAEGPG